MGKAGTEPHVPKNTVAPAQYTESQRTDAGSSAVREQKSFGKIRFGGNGGMTPGRITSLRVAAGIIVLH